MNDTVPEGHRISVVPPQLVPHVAVADGGTWVAQLGTGSDMIADEIAAVVAKIDALRARDLPRVLLARVREIPQMFAPNDPEVLRCQGLLVWVVDADALAGAPDAAALVERWLQQLDTYAQARLPQQVFVHDARSPRARAVADLVWSRGVGVRVVDVAQRAIVIEVHRPEKVVLTALAGHEYAGTAAPAPIPSREELAARLAPTDGSPLVSAVQRAPRLRALLLAAGDAKGRDALYLELVARPIPLLTITSPQGGMRMQQWQGEKMLPAFIDRASLVRAARETSLDLATVNIGHSTATMLCAWADHHKCKVAINVYTDDGKPEYVVIHHDDVAALGRGDVPPTGAVS